MANKYYRQNLRNGTNPTKRKSNIAKIMETFGTKKKDKKEKPKKRMFANMGGGADSGKMGEMKSKVTLLGDKFRKISEKINNKKIKVFDKETNKNIFIDKDVLMNNLKRYSPADTGRLSEKDISMGKKLVNMKKGGRAALKSGTPNPVNQNIGKMNKTFNRAKSDLNKDGKLSGYEKKRGKAIAQAMKSKKKII